MNREEARKRAEAMLAYADGAEIQIRGNAGNWIDSTDPMFIPNAEYRVKPKPREWYLNPSRGTALLVAGVDLIEDGNGKDRVLDEHYVRVREVIDE